MSEEQEKAADEDVIKSLDDYTKQIREITEGGRSCIFRGQSNEGWFLESAAIRRIKNSSNADALTPDNNKIAEENVKYHENLIAKARSRGHGYDEQSRRLHDLEILAILQHNEAATALIDCTKNPYVALWFAIKASQKSAEKECNGKVFVIIKDTGKFGNIEENYFNEQEPTSNTKIPKTISEFLMPERHIGQTSYTISYSVKDMSMLSHIGQTSYTRPIPYSSSINNRILTPMPGNVSERHAHLYWLWEAHRLRNARIIRQSSIFIIGKSKIDKRDYKEIIIPHNAKKKIMDELEILHDINEENLFPDLPGFSIANSVFKVYKIASTRSADEHYKDGLQYREEGKPEQAISQFNRVIEKEPESWIASQASLSRAFSYSDLGKHDLAIEDYTQVLKSQSEYGFGYVQRGLSYHALGKYDEAIADFSKAIKLYPTYVWAYIHRGSSYQAQKKYDKAIDDFNTALKHDPTDDAAYAAYIHRGISYGLRNKHDQAIADFTEAIKINPQYAEAYCNRGVSYIKINKWREAINDFNKAIELDSQDAEAYHYRGICHLRQGNPQRAILDLNKAIEINPKDAYSYYHLGVCYGELKDPERAITNFTKAIEIAPEYALAYCMRGIAKHQSSKGQDEDEDFQTALRLAQEQDNSEIEAHIRERMRKLEIGMPDPDA